MPKPIEPDSKILDLAIGFGLPTLLNDEGKLEIATESPLRVAQRTFKERYKTDTNPAIVQMILRGELVPHWYYRSDEWIDQPLCDLRRFLAPYRGPVTEAESVEYGKGTYRVDVVATDIAQKIAEGQFPNYNL